jgi:N-acetylneuraminate synthase
LLAAIDCYCKELGIDWTASCWDEAAIDFMEPFDPPFYKMASASLTDLLLLRKARATGRPLMVNRNPSSTS